MSRENLHGVDVRKVAKGRYLVNGWAVEDVPGTTGWRVVPNSHSRGSRVRWFATFSQAKAWIAEAGPA